MERSPIKSAEWVGSPEKRPDYNAHRPWAVDYEDAVCFDGSVSPAGTYFFKDDACAVAWRAAVIAGSSFKIEEGQAGE